MKTEKTIIRANLTNACLLSLESAHETRTDGQRTRTDKRTLSNVTLNNVTLSNVTPFALAYADEYAVRMSATALKSIYAQSAHPFVNELYCGVSALCNGETTVNPDAYDVVSVAKSAIMELIASGLVKSPFEMNYYRNFVYASVNRYIHGERRAYNEKTVTKREESMHDEYGAVSTSALLAFWKYVDGKLSDRVDRERAKAVFLLRFSDGLTERETAEKIGVERRVIHRITEYIRAIAETPDAHEYLRGLLID